MPKFFRLGLVSYGIVNITGSHNIWQPQQMHQFRDMSAFTASKTTFSSAMKQKQITIDKLQ